MLDELNDNLHKNYNPHKNDNLHKNYNLHKNDNLHKNFNLHKNYNLQKIFEGAISKRFFEKIIFKMHFLRKPFIWNL